MKTAKELIDNAKNTIKNIIKKSGIRAPFPQDTNSEKIPPIIFKDRQVIDYIHSYGQDSLFFRALCEGKLFGSHCQACQYAWALPKASCSYCGQKTHWQELPLKARVHGFTVCYESSEKMLPEVPYVLAVFEIESADTLFMARLKGVDVASPTVEWIGMEVKAVFSKILKNAKHIPTVLDIWFEPKKE